MEKKKRKYPSNYNTDISDDVIQLCSVTDIVEATNSTRQRVHDWANRANRMGLYVQPTYMAGRANQHRQTMMKLWTFEQMDEIVKKFKKFEEKKRAYRKNRVELNAEEIAAFKPLKPEPEPAVEDDYEDEFDKEREAKALEILNRMNS